MKQPDSVSTENAGESIETSRDDPLPFVGHRAHEHVGEWGQVCQCGMQMFRVFTTGYGPTRQYDFCLDCEAEATF